MYLQDCPIFIQISMNEDKKYSYYYYCYFYFQSSILYIQTGDKEYFPGKIFDDLSQKNQLIYKDMCQEFQKIRPSIVSTLCDDQFNMKLIKLIDKNQKIQAKLIFKGTDDGMSAQAFWSKCQNLGPTLIFCKAENGTVFGSYSPCKWTPNNTDQPDNNLKSFLFNFQRREIYTLTNAKLSIVGNNTNGPCFGNLQDLYISGDFKGGSSILGTYYKVEKPEEIRISTKYMQNLACFVFPR